MRQSPTGVTIAAAALGALAIALIAVQHRSTTGPADQAISGELMAYEQSSRNLTLRTEAGERRFVVQEDAAVHEGAKTITLADLISARGCRAKVWYRNAQGPWTASEVRISCGAILSHDAPKPQLDQR